MITALGAEARAAPTSIIVVQHGATVFRVTRDDGVQSIEKSGAASDISVEAAIMKWRAGRLPVPEVLEVEAGVLSMSALPGVTLTEAEIDCTRRRRPCIASSS